MKKSIFFRTVGISILLFCALFVFLSCNKGDELPKVVVIGINENEKVQSTAEIDGFLINIYETYAEIAGYKGALTSLSMPSKANNMMIRSIGKSAFAGNTKITSAVLPDHLLVIGKYAFDGCTSLTSVTFPDTLETISDYAFRRTGLTTIDLPDNVSGIGKYCFYSSAITSLRIPLNVSKAGKFAFYGCSSLSSIEFTARISSLNENMFYNCTSLTEVIIPKNVTEIESYCFSTCTSLEKIIIPAEVTDFGTGVFFGCNKLTIYAPDGSEAIKYAKKNNYKYEIVDYDEYTAGETK